ncbi:hypothetical protein NliqN6_5703 [Naganishia liquefaciens]|uniref:DUF427 domain-containing protein n=1 Tax=Naganishia liquefaciens TaxID=104408 RepID=A0A8H3TYN0_9TREE|nr:hypothetical protein NliqN6_5703 [Naganishia liquefaciens]
MSASSFISVMVDGEVLVKTAESDAVQVENNWYFPTKDLQNRGQFEESDTHTTCGWKGVASYYNFRKNDGTVLKDIAWYYPTPKKGAEQVADRVAFYVGRKGLKLGSPPVSA